jgi:hypothetical protein
VSVTVRVRALEEDEDVEVEVEVLVLVWSSLVSAVEREVGKSPLLDAVATAVDDVASASVEVDVLRLLGT